MAAPSASAPNSKAESYVSASVVARSDAECTLWAEGSRMAVIREPNPSDLPLTLDDFNATKSAYPIALKTFNFEKERFCALFPAAGFGSEYDTYIEFIQTAGNDKFRPDVGDPDPADIISGFPLLLHSYHTLIDNRRENEALQRQGFDMMIRLAFRKLGYGVKAEYQIALRSNDAGILVDNAKPDILILYSHSNNAILQQIRRAKTSEHCCLLYQYAVVDNRIGSMAFEIKTTSLHAFNQLLFDVGSILCHRKAIGMSQELVFGGTLVAGQFRLWFGKWVDEEFINLYPFSREWSLYLLKDFMEVYALLRFLAQNTLPAFQTYDKADTIQLPQSFKWRAPKLELASGSGRASRAGESSPIKEDKEDAEQDEDAVPHGEEIGSGRGRDSDQGDRGGQSGGGGGNGGSGSGDGAGYDQGQASSGGNARSTGNRRHSSRLAQKSAPKEGDDQATVSDGTCTDEQSLDGAPSVSLTGSGTEDNRSTTYDPETPPLLPMEKFLFQQHLALPPDSDEVTRLPEDYVPLTEPQLAGLDLHIDVLSMRFEDDMKDICPPGHALSLRP